MKAAGRGTGRDEASAARHDELVFAFRTWKCTHPLGADLCEIHGDVS